MRNKTWHTAALAAALAFFAWAGPGGASVTVHGGLAHESTAASGDTYEGDVVIQNNAAAPQAVKIYQTDYQYYADGRNFFDAPGKAPRSNARWIKFSPNYLLIPPGQSLPVHYAVHVPKGTALTGTYWSLLMVQEVGRESEIEQRRQGKYKIGIRTVIRSGVKIITHIGNSGTRKVRILDKRLVQKGAARVFQVDVENTGERALMPAFWVELYNDAGKLVGKLEGTKTAILPGMSVREAVQLPALPKGKYKAMIILDNGDEFVFGAQHKLAL